MSRKLVIDPVTRIEGHGKVVVHLDDDNQVVDAKLHVVEFRGFERFIQGHPYWEAPMLLQRICGICFVSHHLCGAKALDDMVGVGLKQGFNVTPTAEKMRRLGHYAQMLQSHQTAYYYLIAPEMMFGIEAAPEQRNIEGLIEANPELVKRAIALRKWGQEALKAVFGKRMHGISSIPGGVNKNLSIAERDRLLNGEDGLISLDQAIEYAVEGLQVFYDYHDKFRHQFDNFGHAPALDMCLTDAHGNVDYYHGSLRVADADKNVVAEFDYHDYLDHFSEAVEEWSYMKFPYLKALGREAGSVRVGPLARMNITRSLSTPLAQEALERFQHYCKGKASQMTLYYNWARVIEILHSAELIRDLLNDPDLQKDQLLLTPAPGSWCGDGVGVVEAPRGVLLHHYRANESGEITSANLIVSTTQNNQVINRTVRQVAQDWLGGKAEITEGMMNALEVGIRAYDPCLSCATHALGKMPLHVSVIDAQGRVVDERTR
ncbi:MAG: Ni/Fe hydrogenase subunit alpha [Betaproteobacteria bacterium]|nr:Ni/Fe hydrogenase subunit alpha [Betaproteobacteria bacterium]